MVSLHFPLARGQSWVRYSIFIGGLTLLAVLALYLGNNYWANRSYFKPINEGILALHQRRFTDAEKDWLRALVQNPLRPEAYQLLSHLYIETGYPEKAIPLLKHLYAISPTTPHVLCYLAEAYALTNQQNDWLQTARKAVQVEPDCPRAHALLGIIYSNLQDHQEAISELTRASALDPNDPKIATSLAQAQLDNADLDGAARTIKAVIAQHPHYALAYYVLGWDYARRNPTPYNLNTAIQAFEKLQQLDPSHLDAQEELGRLYLLSGNNQKAITILAKAWNQGDHSSECAYNLATAYRNLGLQAKAAAMLQQYQHISNLTLQYNALLKQAVAHPKDITIAAALANLEAEMGNRDKAYQIINSVLQTAPANPIALKTAVKIYASLGDQQAASFYQQRLQALAAKGDIQK